MGVYRMVWQPYRTTAILNVVPLKDGEDALQVNWCELTVSRPDGRVTYHNAFVTRCLITEGMDR